MDEIDFRKALNEQQYAAASWPGGPQLVLAAAGTGKTQTLVYRVAGLVRNGVAPERVLLLTFTNRAAREMLERAAALVGSRVGGLWAGTFHHMANRILRRHADAIGFRSDFAILDRDDSLQLISHALKERKLSTREFPKPEILMSMFGTAANTGRPLAEVIERRFQDEPAPVEQIMEIHDDYQARKQRSGAMDFDDLLLNVLRLFREQPSIQGQYGEQFMHILVDEYQDTSPIQAEIVDRLAKCHRNVFVVGDDFQCIYSWRGADFRNIMSFPERYPDARVFKLEINYRSTPGILDVANACIAGNPEQFQKQLRATREPGAKPRVVSMRDGEEQARYVVEQVQLLRRAGHRLSDIAILYRAHFHAMELQLCLAREQVRYAITSGVRFFEQAHIKDVCSVLRILVSPNDELAFLRLLGMLPGVGPRTATKLWMRLGGVLDARDPSALERLRSGLPAAASAAWSSIEPVLRAYHSEKLNDDGGEVIHQFTRAFYETHASNIFEDYERRLDDINELVLYTAKFERVEDFLEDVALLTNLDAEMENPGAASGDMLKLSTVHQAKGLEWPAVIVVWATDGMFPSSRTLRESTVGEAEERRLFYVAVTRARDDLIFCAPEVRRNRDGGVMNCLPSRFIQEIPPGLLKTERAGFI